MKFHLNQKFIYTWLQWLMIVTIYQKQYSQRVQQILSFLFLQRQADEMMNWNNRYPLVHVLEKSTHNTLVHHECTHNTMQRARLHAYVHVLGISVAIGLSLWWLSTLLGLVIIQEQRVLLTCCLFVEQLNDIGIGWMRLGQNQQHHAHNSLHI